MFSYTDSLFSVCMGIVINLKYIVLYDGDCGPNVIDKTDITFSNRTCFNLIRQPEVVANRKSVSVVKCSVSDLISTLIGVFVPSTEEH